MSESLKPGYDRVTEILYPFTGYSGVPKEILEEAARRGKLVHDEIEKNIQGMDLFFDLEDLNDKPQLSGISGYLNSFKQWKGNKKFIATPERWYDENLKITGECDAIYKNENGYTLVDFKTSSKVNEMWRYQGLWYCYLHLNSGSPVKITQLEFLKVEKDGSAPKSIFYPCELDNNPDKKLALDMLNIYRTFFKNKKPLDWETI